jgi:hypothetical protein
MPIRRAARPAPDHRGDDPRPLNKFRVSPPAHQDRVPAALERVGLRAHPARRFPHDVSPPAMATMHPSEIGRAEALRTPRHP